MSMPKARAIGSTMGSMISMIDTESMMQPSAMTMAM